MAQKRKRPEEFDTFATIAEVESASVHGLVGSLSPMKKGKKATYFEGKLVDDHRQVRVVGFNPTQRTTLADFQAKSVPINVADCQIKQARHSSDLEIVMHSRTTIQASPKKISTNISAATSSAITLDQMQSLNDYDKLSFEAKVLSVDQPAKVAKGLTKQDIVLADKHASVKLTLWQDKVNTVDLDESYRFTNVVVRSYQNTKYLSMPKEGASIEQISDIGDVAEDDTTSLDVTIEGAKVIGVASLEDQHACLACKSKVNPVDDTIGACTKCDMHQLLDKCTKQLKTKLYIASGDQYFTLHAFGTTVSDIADESAPTKLTLLRAKPFTLTHNMNIITSITRP